MIDLNEKKIVNIKENTPVAHDLAVKEIRAATARAAAMRGNVSTNSIRNSSEDSNTNVSKESGTEKQSRKITTDPTAEIEAIREEIARLDSNEYQKHGTRKAHTVFLAREMGLLFCGKANDRNCIKKPWCVAIQNYDR